MESEEMKEIKEKLQEEIFIANSFGDKWRKVPTKELEKILTLINELESENERLNKALVDNLEAYIADLDKEGKVVMRRKHNGKIYFPHYEETWLGDTLTAMAKSMQETGHLYYVEWNGKFYYSDEVKIDGNLVMCEGKND